MVQTTRAVLTERQRRAAEEDGYFVVEGLVSPAACQRFIQRLDDYARKRRPLPAGLNVQREPRVARGTLQAAPGEDVRKISGVAQGDDLFGALVVQPEIVRIIQELTSPNVKLFRADVLMKPAGVGSAKGMHQDSPYWPIEPMALWSCWLPFDRSLLENGCMTAIPGSHTRGPLPHVRVTDDYIIPDEHYDPDDVVAIPMEPGSGLFFHSLLLHGTAENRSPLPRRAITMSYMATESRYTGQSPRPEYLRICGKAMSTLPGADESIRHNLHRGGLADDPARLRPDPTLFARMGGRAVVAQIVDAFYDRVQADPLLGPLFNHSERHNIVARDRQRRFFEEWLGGASRYTDDEAHPLMQGLQRRHYPFPITAQLAGRWLHHMSASLRECGIGPDIVSEIMSRLAPMARRMVNEEEQAPNGNNPMRQRQARIASAWELAARGNRDGLRPLIERDPGLVTLRSIAGRTLLWEATRRGRRPVVELLVEQGADVNAPGCDQMFHFPYARAGSTLVMITPYCLAKWRGNDDLAAYLLSQGAVIDIYTAAFLGDVPHVTALLDASPELVNAEDPAEDFLPRTPLHHAVSGGQREVAELLLARGAEVARHSRWLLTYAAVRNRLDLVQLLLAHGAEARESLVLGPLGTGKDQAIADTLIAHGFDLHRRPMAFEHSRADTGGGPAVVQALLEYGADPNARGPDGRAALHLAAQSGNLELIAVLLAYGADANIVDEASTTPLIATLRRKSQQRSAAIAALLAGGADPNVRMGSETPLHKVARDNDIAIAKLLLAHGANGAALDTRGRTPLTVAARKGHAEMVALLRQHAA